ncbi:MAG TPA: hypothetical protein VGW76_20545 [Pyrinomonadaceae bacterium]|nr:hypothetical protein [Pyrinomonadaceae bacterium]
MKRTFRVPAKQTVALIILIAASVVPVYAQQVESPLKPESTRLTFVQASSDLTSKATGTAADTDSGQTSTKQTTPEPYVFPTHAERFKRYVDSAVGPFTLARTAVSAGINQWRDNPEEWEQGASGYGKRFASSFGKHAIQQTITYGLDEALGLDTGFKRSTRQGFGPRLKDALLDNVTSRNRKGNRVVSVPRFAGAYTAAIIRAETWYPARYDYKDGLRSGTTSILSGFAFNVLREFVIRR